MSGELRARISGISLLSKRFKRSNSPGVWVVIRSSSAGSAIRLDHDSFQGIRFAPIGEIHFLTLPATGRVLGIRTYALVVQIRGCGDQTDITPNDSEEHNGTSGSRRLAHLYESRVSTPRQRLPSNALIETAPDRIYVLPSGLHSERFR
jgi:hypothetical protein